MFKLNDIRKSRVRQEAHEEGRVEERQELVKYLRKKGWPFKQIAEWVEISVAQASVSQRQSYSEITFPTAPENRGHRVRRCRFHDLLS